MNRDFFKTNLPGILFCTILAIVILFIFEQVETKIIDTLLTGLIVGIVIKNTGIPIIKFEKGIKFSGKHILEFAVMLMGASIFLPDLFENGLRILLIIIIGITGSMGISYIVGHKILNLDKKLATLVGVGNSICGNSAVAVVAPVIKANSTQIGAAIGISAILGASQIILLPLLVPAFGLENFQYGIVAGLSVYAVAQVVAASSIVSSLSADIATLVKLTRVILLAPLVLVLRILFKSDQDEKTDSNLLSSILKYLPWFVIGFILLSVLRSTEIISQGIGLDIRSIAKFLFVLSMIAIGLTVNIKEIVKVGPKVALTIMLIIIYMVILGISSSNFI
tara:strand:- start:2392 stop:3399 length:1008 start_codon:yes stop_codon:yes gene_type:complete